MKFLILLFLMPLKVYAEIDVIDALENELLKNSYFKDSNPKENISYDEVNEVNEVNQIDEEKLYQEMDELTHSIQNLEIELNDVSNIMISEANINNLTTIEIVNESFNDVDLKITDVFLDGIKITTSPSINQSNKTITIYQSILEPGIHDLDISLKAQFKNDPFKIILHPVQKIKVKIEKEIIKPVIMLSYQADKNKMTSILSEKK